MSENSNGANLIFLTVLGKENTNYQRCLLSGNYMFQRNLNVKLWLVHEMPISDIFTEQSSSKWAFLCHL